MPIQNFPDPSHEMESYPGKTPTQIQELGFNGAALVASGGLAVAAYMAQKYGYTKDLIIPIKEITQSLSHIFPGILGAIVGYKAARKKYPDDRSKAIHWALYGGVAANIGVELSQEAIISSPEKSLSNPDMIPENFKDGVVSTVTSFLMAKKLAKFDETSDRERNAFAKNGTYDE